MLGRRALCKAAAEARDWANVRLDSDAMATLYHNLIVWLPMRKIATITILFATIVFAVPAGAASCESLASLTLPDATITSAQTVAAGEFTPPAGGPPGQMNFKGLPAFCRVSATLAPSKDSEIKIEVWMPSSGWNSKFQAVGNGGWSGSISYPSLGRALANGY